jgi:hypothetical protein
MAFHHNLEWKADSRIPQSLPSLVGKSVIYRKMRESSILFADFFDRVHDDWWSDCAESIANSFLNRTLFFRSLLE